MKVVAVGIGGAADRHPPGRKAPRLVINIRSRRIQRSQLVVGVVGEPELLAGTGVMVFVNPRGTHGNCMGIAQILILGVDPDVGEGIIARGGHPHRDDFRGQAESADFP